MKEFRKYRIATHRRFHWDEIDPGDHGPFASEDEAVAETEEAVRKLDPLQERLYAEGKQSLLVILQALDTGGKDGTIRHVTRGINPQGCNVTPFKLPTPEERAHDFLWRIHQHVPAKGMIGIFNRSHYEDVLVTRVHRVITGEVARRRLDEINDFERMLSQNGTRIVKFYLKISKAEQRRRLQARLDDPLKRWKFSTSDLSERRYWDRYPKYCAEAINATSTKHAPWYVIPANHKWYRNYLVARILHSTLKEMDPQFPARKRMAKIRIT